MSQAMRNIMVVMLNDNATRSQALLDFARGVEEVTFEELYGVVYSLVSVRAINDNDMNVDLEFKAYVIERLESRLEALEHQYREAMDNL
eukprot:11505342-Prorocentrum_lima.AAC.1